ncbi:hypothetical protein [Deinococcus navajonensis]|uniref:Uncharacterized protein n=1 Tax=Deinococcus navajonensis TaxID=309884 RepID=A0ABV8XJF3_9DEIO
MPRVLTPLVAAEVTGLLLATAHVMCASYSHRYFRRVMDAKLDWTFFAADGVILVLFVAVHWRTRGVSGPGVTLSRGVARLALLLQVLMFVVALGRGPAL